mgnify:CR=1 FL=1
MTIGTGDDGISIPVYVPQGAEQLELLTRIAAAVGNTEIGRAHV